MGVQYIGFSGDQRKLIQRADIQAGCAIQFALDLALHNNDAFMRGMETYIGPASKNSSAVMAILNSMILAIRQGTYDIHMVGATGSTLASAETLGDAKHGYALDKSDKTYHVPYVAKAQDSAKANDKLILKIRPSFFGLPFKAKDVDTQVETLIHELSHHAANTDDEVVNGKTCYGLSGVRSAKQAGKGANNADNIGYFVASFQNFA